MLRRRLLVGLPAAATAFVIAILLGPGQPRAVVGARLHGAPAEGGVRSLRILTVARVDVREKPTAEAKLALYVGGAAEPRWRGETNVHGVADVALDPPIDRGVSLRLVDGEGTTLANGPIEGPEAGGVQISKGLVHGTAEGELTVTASLRRGLTVPSFEEDLEVSVMRGESAAQGALEIELTGAEPASSRLELSSEGRARLRVRVLAEPSDLEVRAIHPSGARGSLRARLPTVMGGFVPGTTTSVDQEVTISASGPREVAFVSYFDERGRIGGETLRLFLDGSGYHRGEAILPNGATSLSIASDALETAGSTTAWPTPGREGRAVVPKLQLLLNGVPDALGRERSRIGRVRVATVTGLAALALAEVLLLVSLSRAARTASANARGSDPDSPEASSLPEDDAARLRSSRAASDRPGLVVALVAGALLVLAFGAMAALAVFR